MFNNQADLNFLNVINLPASLWICYSNDWFELQMLNDDLQTFRLPIYTWNTRSSSTQILSDEDESRKKIGNYLADQTESEHFEMRHHLQDRISSLVQRTQFNVIILGPTMTYYFTEW